MNLDVAHRSRPCHGETRSGDAALCRTDGDTTLLAVIDALGHGPIAADTAQQAVDFLQGVTLRGGLSGLMQGLHRALHASRGAAATLCLVGPKGFEASGVGNVGLRVFGATLSFILTPGILGARLRTLRVFQGEVRPKARLLLHSDGVTPMFTEQEAMLGSARECCEAILRRYGREQDDATVLIAEFLP